MGTSVEVEVVGNDLEGATTLLFDQAGIKATPVEGKERRFNVSVAAEVPEGTYDARLVGRFGVSSPRLFSVARDLADVTEKEPNNVPGEAQAVALNVAINGSSDGNGEDVFKFAAKKDQRIVIQCLAALLDSPLDANLALTSSTGTQLAASSDYHGRDPLIDFVAPADGEYLVTIFDLSYRGGFPYRLIISDRPQIENVFPRAVQAGQATELTVLGRNLGAGAKPSACKVGDLPLDEMRVSNTPPADLLSLGAYRFIEHPTDHSVLPTAATCTLTGFQPRLGLAGQINPTPPLLVTDGPVALEAEPNDSPEKPQPISLPAVVSGRFDAPRDADWFEFESGEAGNYSFNVYCERIAGRADPYLVVQDEQGNRVNELDDFGHRINAFDGHLRDPSGPVNLAAKKKYRVLVQDRYRRGGARFQYVLTVRKPTPDFYAAVIHSQNPGPGGTTIWRGGAAHIDVVTHYEGGFNGPLVITAEGLPPGVTCAPTSIMGETRATLVFWADENAPEFAGPVKLFATAKLGEATVRRKVRPYSRVTSEANQNSSRPTRELYLAVREKAPYSLSFAPDRIDIESGKKAEVKLSLARLWPDFKSNVNVTPLAFPGNIKLANLEFSPDKTEAQVTLEVQAGTRPGEYTLCVQGQSQVPFSKDPAATARPNTLVTLPSRPITINVVAPAK